MIKTLKDAFKQKDLRNKILFTLLCLLIYRIGCFLPVPGISPEMFKAEVEAEGAAGSFLSLISSLSGGALSKGAILALGVGPYITSSIVVQLLTIAIPAMERLSQQGSDGRKKLAVITRYVALVLALAQAIAIVVNLDVKSSLLWTESNAVEGTVTGAQTVIIRAIVICTLVAGSIFTVWLGDKMTEFGVSNGMSMLVFIGILSSGVGAFYNSVVAVFEDISAITTPIVFIFILVFIFTVIVYFDLSERRIPVTYAKQVKGNKMYGGQTANIPIKLNATGVMPIIFALSLINFPQLIMSFFVSNEGWAKAYQWYATYMGTGSWANMVATALLILAFTYFYATLSFNPRDVAQQIQRNGGFILGYRPGKPTTDYLKKVSNRITLFGAMFLMFMALVPSLIFKALRIDDNPLTTAFTSIGMLIIVSVALEFDKQVQAQMLMKQYKGFLK